MIGMHINRCCYIINPDSIELYLEDKSDEQCILPFVVDYAAHRFMSPGCSSAARVLAAVRQRS